MIIALPLHLHAPVAIEAMKAGKHVLTEKLMAHSVHECKEMARVAAADEASILATGHQRHYSILYDNAVDMIQRGLIGEMHYIRAQWHRGNMPGKDSWSPPLPDDKMEAAGQSASDLEAPRSWRSTKPSEEVAELLKVSEIEAARGSAIDALAARGRPVGGCNTSTRTSTPPSTATRTSHALAATASYAARRWKS